MTDRRHNGGYDWLTDDAQLPEHKQWLYTDTFTLRGLDAVRESLSPSNRDEWDDMDRAVQIAFLYKQLETGNISLDFPSHPETDPEPDE